MSTQPKQETYTWHEMGELMRKYNDEHGYTTKGTATHIYAVAVIDKHSMPGYSKVERSYRFSNDNKAFLPNQLSNSVFADCLDGDDLGVRLDWYISPDGWKVEYCHIDYGYSKESTDGKK